jgi:DNA-binding NarL/FixJ family response regulator
MDLSEQARSVLVVEDDPLVSSYVSEVLSECGFTVSGPASSGAEALALAESTRPKLALVDIGLLGAMDGIEVARQLRECLSIAVIFLTGLADPATKNRSQIAHPAGFLRKPFKPSQVITAIEKAFAAEREKPATFAAGAIQVSQMHEAKIRTYAQAMIERHGAKATLRSVEAINAAIDAGNSTERDHWAQVFRAIQESVGAS